MSTETFQSFWYGSELSPRERLCLASFVERGKDFDLYVYDDSLSVPVGVSLRDASEIYSEEEVFAYQRGPGKGSVAVFADLFRYKLLYERGGWWVDTDVLYLGHEVPNAEEYFVWQHDSEVAIGVLKLPKGCDIAEECLRCIRSMGKNTVASSWGSSGPELFTRVLEDKGRIHEARPKPCAYPVSWREAHASYLSERREEVEDKVEGSPFYHLWNENLRRMGVQKNIAPPEGSYLDRLAKELDVTWPCPEVCYSDETVRRLAQNWLKAREAKWKGLELRKIRSSTTWQIFSGINSLRRKVGI
ncbi:MAG: glycosyltransferase [Salinibacter sp.]